MTASSLVASAVPPEKFNARKEFQHKAPYAFVLEPEGALYLEQLNTQAIQDADAFSNSLLGDHVFSAKLKNFPTVTLDQKKNILKDLFAREIASLQKSHLGQFTLEPPILDLNDQFKAPAYFDFDLADPSNPGKIVINLIDAEVLNRPNAAISFLVHETRHSFQLQFARQMVAQPTYAKLSAGFLSAFQAQKTMRGFTRMDFYTLANEYEAFLFGDRVILRVFDHTIDFLDMGSFASQFKSDETLKLDILTLQRDWNHGFLETGSVDPERAEKLFDQFNALEEIQRGEM